MAKNGPHRGGRPNLGKTSLQELAWVKVFYAVKTGKLKRPNICNRCGNGALKIEAHHEDYSKPLDVIWLCKDCHYNTFNTAVGERVANSRLSSIQVLSIRKELSLGVRRIDLARKYGVNESTIERIKNRKTWKHLP